MAKNITYDEYLDIIIKKAAEAAKARAEYNKEIWGEGWSKDPYSSTLKYANDYREQLMKKKPYDGITEKELSDIAQFPADSAFRWVDGNFKGPSPWEMQKQMEASKILPLLLGAAEDGKDWYSRSALDLQGIGKQEFDYDTSTPEGFQGFLSKLGEYQQQYDRAKLLNEYQNKGADYWLGKLLYPATTQEIENAIATGEGGDEETLNKLKKLDVATDYAMALSPSVAIKGINPFLMGTLDAVVGQGGAEAVRQFAKEKLSKTGQEANYSDAILAASIGATRPGMATMAAGGIQSFPGKVAQDISRGFRKAARTGGSEERQAIKNAIDLYNKDLADAVNKSKNGMPGFRADFTGSKYDDAVKVPEMAKLFGVAPDEKGKYSAKAILDYYDAPSRAPKIATAKNGNLTLELAENSVIPEADEFKRSVVSKLLGNVEPVVRIPANVVADTKYPVPNVIRTVAQKVSESRKPEIMLGKDKFSQYQSLFKDKASEMDANRAAMLFGQILGKGVADAGSRVEPIAKGNPFNLNDSESLRKPYTESYKKESWYVNLNPEAKKILDDAFKKKED